MVEQCSDCHEYMWSFDGIHRCKPKWELQESHRHDGKFDEDDYTQTVYAYDEEAAAEKWADESDCEGDYSIVGGTEATVRVRSCGSEDEWKIFIVSGETVAQYHATEKTS